MGLKSSMLGIWSRLPAVFFLGLLLLVPDFRSDIHQSVPVNHLVLDGTTTDIAQVIRLPASAWESTDGKSKMKPDGGKVIHWYRLDLDELPEQEGDWIASLHGAKILDFSRIDFYLVSNADIERHITVGDDYPETFASQSDHGYHFQFGSKTAASTLYVKTESQGDVAVVPKVYRESDYRVYVRKLTIQWAILNGCLIGFTIYVLVLFFILRDLSFAYLAMWLSSNVIITLYFTHFTKVVLPQLAIGRGFEFRMAAVAFGLFFVFIYLFAGRFFDYRRNFPRLHRYLKIHLYVSIAVAASFAFASPDIIFKIGLLATGGAIARNLIIYQGYMNKSFVFLFATAISFYLVGGVVFLLAEVGILESTQVRECALHFGAILSAATFSLSMSLRLRYMENRHKQIINAFRKDGDLVRLNALLNESFSGHFNTSQLDISMIFIDIASFSEIAVGQSQERIYQELALVMDDVFKIIEEHNGSIDRSMGAGVLALFGYKRVGKSFDPSLDAFKAASRIQEMNVKRALDCGDSKMIMPLRIGIHTARVTVGNLGDQDRLDFTVIGAGVNFASRLKEACSPYKIMVSAAVAEQLQLAEVDVSMFTPISIAVKHQTKLLQAFEFNPFSEARDLLQRAETVFLDRIGMRSLDQRFRLRSGGAIRLKSDVGEFVVQDFSRYGFRAIGDRLLGRQTIISTRIETSDPAVNALLAEALLAEFALEVRWSKRSDSGNEHGFKIHGGGSRQCDFIFRSLSAALAGHEIHQAVDEVVTEVAS
ncbi:MAG: hypothetical protein FJ146_06510 [Deltaproteobacteria bacterium]|nr:hypothetical protein [Deltaproteobacteria bacterium]